MPIESTLSALPVTDLAVLGGVAVLCCVLGWQLRRMATRGHQVKLRRSMLEAKSAVPQLEAAVRHREQRAGTLELEIKALKDRLSELETSGRQQETEIVKRDREIRMLSSELMILKAAAGTVVCTGFLTLLHRPQILIRKCRYPRRACVEQRSFDRTVGGASPKRLSFCLVRRDLSP